MRNLLKENDMQTIKEKQKYAYNATMIALYEWRLLLAEEEISNNFRILRSLQRPNIDLMVKKMSELDIQTRKETCVAFVKRFYDHALYPNLKPTSHEQELLDYILNYTPLVYPECAYDMNKLKEYEEKKKLYGKKIYRQKLFNRLKKKLKENFKMKFETNDINIIEFNTFFTDKIQISTAMYVDNKNYDYYHNLYINGSRVQLACNHATLIGFPSEWVIHQEEDIDTTLNMIWSFCQEFFEKASRILSELDLDV
jgi:hypothetical protein